jgi:hypothetical protein
MREMVLTTRTVVCEGLNQDMPAMCSGAPPGGPPSKQNDRDELKFFALAALTLVCPAVAYCITINSLWPFYWMICNLILGIALGLVMYSAAPFRFQPCISETGTASMPLRPGFLEPKRGNPVWLRGTKESFA